MAVNYSVVGKRNVVFSQSEQTALSASGGDLTFSLTPPERWSEGTIGESVTLDDILETVDIRYVASTAGYSNGDTVNSWVNSGSLDGYDLQNENLDTTVHPEFDTDDAANPFQDGAMKFVISDSDYNSDYLYWGTNNARKTLSPEGGFTLYMVMATTSASNKKGHFPLWVRGTLEGQGETKSQTAVDAFATPISSQFTTRLKGTEFTSLEVDPIASTIITDEKYSSSNISDKFVIVITVDADGKVRSYNSNAKQSTEATIDSSRKWKAETFGGPDGKNLLLPHDRVTGDTLYLAEFGYWGSKLDGQQAAALGRLLGDKYQIS